jgi:NAD(P)-dependent dehydrogenase (short-subunit alcohol dehydrogenase family)
MAASTVARRLGAKTFRQDDQQWFACASHDWNPMHMDPVLARRLLTGRQVAHGIHTLLSALDLWQSESGASLGTVQCEFNNPVNVDDTVVFTCFDESPGQTTILATVDGLTCTHVSIDTAEPGLPAGHATSESVAGTTWLAPLDAPLVEAPAEQVGRTFVLAASNSEQLAGRFPSLAAALLPQRVAAIATLSQFVGMVCPGLHSVFSSVRFAIGDQAAAGNELTFFVKKYDARFRLFIITFEGCIRGEIRAFLRPPPQLQPSMRDVSAQVSPGEFGGTRSLVLGGSRGLGETVAKILAAGHGDVIVTHASGADDARRVADEINALRPGRCTTLKLDLTSDAFDGLGIDAGSLNSVYFFATPRIFRKKTGLFDRSLFDEFITFYVDRFAELCKWLEDGASGRRIKVYLPSTVFIADRPKGMTEYAMAKAAAELLAEDMNRSLTNVSVVCSRLPRLATDQTASITTPATELNLDVLMQVVRDVSGRGRGRGGDA